MNEVKVYYLEENPQLSEIREWLDNLSSSYEIKVEYLDITKSTKIKITEQSTLPLIIIEPYTLKFPFTFQQIEISLRAALDRNKQITQIDGNLAATSGGIQKITGADKFSFWFSKKYMLFFITALFLYVATPFLAPIFLKAGLEFPAKVIYAIYSPLCHQLPFRSFFLFGEQVYYPRYLAGINGVITYEEITGNSRLNVWEDRKIVGGEQFPNMGYKVAICERCVAIYFAMFLMACIFTITGRKIKSIPWYIWVLFGVIPMGVDGASQLPGAIAEILPSWLPIRESTPSLRIITGGLFGITTAWFLFPMIEETLSETRRFLEKRIIFKKDNR